jgi:hypothetical protein
MGDEVTIMLMFWTSLSWLGRLGFIVGESMLFLEGSGGKSTTRLRPKAGMGSSR